MKSPREGGDYPLCECVVCVCVCTVSQQQRSFVQSGDFFFIVYCKLHFGLCNSLLCTWWVSRLFENVLLPEKREGKKRKIKGMPVA